MINTIVVAGVGGQGVLLASDTLTELFKNAGYDVKKSEVHGMSQRGGDVVSTVRWGKIVYSPIIGKNGADYILALEKLEGLRALPLLKPNGTIILNSYQFNPLPVSAGLAKYPENITEFLKKQVKDVYEVDALTIALELGNARIMNIIMLGALAKKLDINKSVWIKTLEYMVPKKFLDINLKGFEKGYEAVN
jgi:indolepyruvate ferredoxin oxidoreductase beta subunit